MIRGLAVRFLINELETGQRPVYAEIMGSLFDALGKMHKKMDKDVFIMMTIDHGSIRGTVTAVSSVTMPPTPHNRSILFARMILN